jgi:hypothetical protein
MRTAVVYLVVYGLALVLVLILAAGVIAYVSARRPDRPPRRR